MPRVVGSLKIQSFRISVLRILSGSVILGEKLVMFSYCAVYDYFGMMFSAHIFDYVFCLYFYLSVVITVYFWKSVYVVCLSFG